MHERRFTPDQIAQWRTDGFVIIPEFFTPAEIAPVILDYERLYGDRRAAAEPVALVEKLPGELGRFRREQFNNIDTLPYDGSPALNLLSLHPALIDLSRTALDVQRVHLYQSHTWAKFTGDADYDQPFHCDFGNHTLVVPADQVALRTVDIIIYLTDVTNAHGALHYVTKPDADECLRPGALAANAADQQALLRSRERSAAAPAGSIVVHGIDTFHRGTNLTHPGGHRYTMTVGYKAAGNDMIGFHVWQVREDRNWAPLLQHATPEQLAALGIPQPGDPFWTPRTLKLTQARWPDWNMRPYFDLAQGL